MIYLASPYSHPDPDVRADRAARVATVAARLFCSGAKVYCPIAAWHWVALEHDLPKHWVTWRALDFEFLRHATELFVLKLDGWEESVGVSAEIDLAEHMEIPVTYIDETFGTH